MLEKANLGSFLETKAMAKITLVCALLHTSKFLPLRASRAQLPSREGAFVPEGGGQLGTYHSSNFHLSDALLKSNSPPFSFHNAVFFPLPI